MFGCSWSNNVQTRRRTSSSVRYIVHQGTHAAFSRFEIQEPAELAQIMLSHGVYLINGGSSLFFCFFVHDLWSSNLVSQCCFGGPHLQAREKIIGVHVCTSQNCGFRSQRIRVGCLKASILPFSFQIKHTSTSTRESQMELESRSMAF
jgi:hypothetical protein